MRVLLSIKPEYADRIFDGSKSFEFRRRPYSNTAIKTVVVYATRPVGMIVGEFDVETIIEESPSALWRLTETQSGITRDFFDSYFEGREVAYALKISDARRYHTPIEPRDVLGNFTPPQSYMYVPDGDPLSWEAGRQLSLV